MLAQDVMTTEVITAHPEAPVRAIAKLMAEHHISGLPIIDDAMSLAGIVTSGDLYRRAELGTEGRHSHWLDLFAIDSRRPTDDVGWRRRVARDVMTANVIAVAPATSLRQIANLFEAKRIHRVPVLDDGLLVGIVCRANLVQSVAVTFPDNKRGRRRDQRVRNIVLARYNRLSCGIPREGNVIVADGVVHVWGYLPSAADVEILRITAEDIQGVTGFENHTYRYFGEISGWNKVNSAVTMVGPADEEA